MKWPLSSLTAWRAAVPPPERTMATPRSKGYASVSRGADNDAHFYDELLRNDGWYAGQHSGPCACRTVGTTMRGVSGVLSGPRRPALTVQFVRATSLVGSLLAALSEFAELLWHFVKSAPFA